MYSSGTIPKEDWSDHASSMESVSSKSWGHAPIRLDFGLPKRLQKKEKPEKEVKAAPKKKTQVKNK
jgi:hypothetical protein